MDRMRNRFLTAVLMTCALAAPAAALIVERPMLLTDNTGRVIGTVEGQSASDTVTAKLMVKVNGHLGKLVVLRNGAMQGDLTEVVFTGGTCSGAPYGFFNQGRPIRDFIGLTGVYPNLRFFHGSRGATLQSPGAGGSELTFNNATCQATSIPLDGQSVVLTEDTVAAAELNALQQPFSVIADDNGQTVFTPLTPCRLVDTRTGNGGIFTAGATRTFTVVGNCGVPGYQGGAPFVKAVLLNVAVISPTGNGNLKAYPGDQSPPSTSNINFTSGENVANSITILMAQDAVSGNDIGIQVNISSAHVVIDVYGYYTQ